MRTNRCCHGCALALLAIIPTLALHAQSPQVPPPSAPATAAPKLVVDKSADQSDPALPPGREILNRYIAALGGRAAILRHTSAHSSGTVAIPSAGITGSMEIFAAKPNKTVARMTMGGVGQIQEGFDGTNGWSLSPITGPTLTQGRELEQKKFDSDYYGELHSDDRYESITTVEKTTFDGRPCYKVRLVRRGGGEDFEFYDVETALKAGSIITRDTPMGPVSGTTIFGEYRRFGDVMYPTSVKLSLMNGLQQIVTTITSVEFDKVDPSIFEPPAQIKALIR